MQDCWLKFYELKIIYLIKKPQIGYAQVSKYSKKKKQSIIRFK